MSTRFVQVPVTTALIAACIGIYLLMQWNQVWVMRGLLISTYYQPTLPEIQLGEIWRLVTPAFLHFGIFHIAFNLIWIWEFGRLIEDRQGSLILTGLFLAGSISANIAQYLVGGPVFGGISGVVYAWFGYVWIQGLTNPHFGAHLHRPVVYLLLGWFLICWTGILELLFGLTIANTAHTAGLGSGLLASFLVTIGQMRSFRKRG